MKIKGQIERLSKKSRQETSILASEDDFENLLANYQPTKQTRTKWIVAIVNQIRQTVGKGVWQFTLPLLGI